MQNNTELQEFDLIDSAAIKRYFSLVLRWSWLIVILAALGGVGAFLYARSQTPIYRTTTRVLISRPAQEQSTDLTRSLNTQQMTETYIQLAKIGPVLQEVSETLGIPVSSGMISASGVTNTQIIQVSVEHRNPQTAVDIANTLVQVLVKQSDAIEAVRYADTETSLNTQIADMQAQIKSIQSQIDERNTAVFAEQKGQLEAQMAFLQQEISTLQNEIAILNAVGSPESQLQVTDKRATLSQKQSLFNSYQQTYTALIVQKRITGVDDPDLTRLSKELALYQQIYLNLVNSRESVRLAKLQEATNLVQIDQPPLPRLPVRPNVSTNTTLGAVAGAVLALVAIFVVDFLDDTLKSADDIRRILDLGVMGYVGEFEEEHGNLFVAVNPRAPVSESFRTMRTNIEFAGVDRPIKKLLVTSSAPGEGKTTISVNLAGVMAQGGKKVLVLDTDLRRPNVHRLLGLTNRFGLSDVFRGTSRLAEVIQPYTGANGTSFGVVTTGAIPPNPAELISSAKMATILKEAADMVDILIVDSPPLVVTDAQVLASRTDGVLVVIHTGQSRADAARYAVEQLRQGGSRVLGTVLNRIQRQHSSYGTHYAPYYYHRSGYFTDSKEKKGFWERIFSRSPKPQKPAAPTE